MPRISICIPLYNRQELVKETLDSILAQTFTDWECIIVDDRSTDDSFKVAQSYAERDSRITATIRPEDKIKGGNTCRNIGFENSTGDLVYFFDSDDLISPGLFEEMVKTMDAHPDAEYGLVPANLFLHKDGTKLSEYVFLRSAEGDLQGKTQNSAFHNLISMKFQLCSPTQIWRRSLLNKCVAQTGMLWREGLVKGQDPDMGFRAIACAERGINIDMPTMVHVRLHDNRSGSRAFRKREIGQVLVDMYIRSFQCLDSNGKLTPEDKSLFLNGVLRKTRLSAVMHGDGEASKALYKFICAQGAALPGWRTLRCKGKLLWFLTPFYYFFGAPVYARRNNPIIRRIKQWVG